MKKYLIIPLFAAISLTAQTAIGKTAISNNSVSVEFGNGNRGIILPWIPTVETMPNVADGTLVHDVSSGIMKLRENGNWKELSFNVRNVQDGLGNFISDTTGKADISQQSGLTDNPAQKTIIGNTAEDTSGVLVLSESNKAMILPKVASPHLNIINPAPGMIVYDTDTKQLAVFNGTVWSFWGADQ